MRRLPLLFIPFVLSLVPSLAQAVQTRLCPETLRVSVTELKVYTADEIRGIQRHSKYTKEMLEEAFASRDRAEKHLPNAVETAEFTLKKRENGKCTYWIDGPELRSIATAQSANAALKDVMAVLNTRRIVLYTKAGQNFMREEFQLPYQRRESETFLIESVLTEYSPAGVKLTANEKTPLKVTVRYPCYDHRCLSEATIGQGTQDVQ